MKLICFPHAGGMAGYYSFLEREGIKGISEVVICDYPGRGRNSSELCYRCFDDCIKDMCDKIVSLGVSDGSFVLFGHSMGAFVAYETACKLRKDYNLNPFHVFLSGQKPPCKVVPDHYKFCEDNGMKFLKELGGVPDVILQNKEVANFFLEICITDLRVLQSYKPHMPDVNNRPFRGSIICGDNDVEVTIEEVDDWKEYFENEVTINIVSGTHFYFQNEHKELVEFMNEEMKRNLELRDK